MDKTAETCNDNALPSAAPTPATATGAPTLPETAKSASDFQRCLNLIQPGTPDESKFLGLMLMSEFLVNRDPTIIQQFFDHIDFAFLDRMMLIKPLEVPPNSGVNDKMIKTIAIDILACFSSEWKLMITPQFKDRLPAMLTLLEPNDRSENSQNILKILLKISSYPQISMILTNPAYQSKIVAYIIASLGSTEETHKDAVLVCIRTFLIIREGFVQNADATLQITKEFIPSILIQLSIPFSNPAEVHKAELLEMLMEAIAFLPEALIKSHLTTVPEQKSAVWIKNLKSGLTQILTIKTKTPKIRDSAMVLVGLLLQRLGSSWLFPDPKKSSGTNRATGSSKAKNSNGLSGLDTTMSSLSLSDQDLSKKFAELVVHLTSVEVRVLMDELGEDPTLFPTVAKSKNSEPILPVSPVSQNSNDPFKKPVNVRQEQVLPICYEILETTLQYLIKVSEDEEAQEYGIFDATGLLKVQQSLEASFSAILDFLKDLQGQAHITPERLSKNMVFLASLRILSVWLMEDDSLHGQASELEPMVGSLLAYCQSKPKFKTLVKMLRPIHDQFLDL